MKTFVEFWTQLLLNVETFASEKWNELKRDAVDDAMNFLTGIKDDVQRWISLLATGASNLRGSPLAHKRKTGPGRAPLP